MMMMMMTEEDKGGRNNSSSSNIKISSDSEMIMNSSKSSNPTQQLQSEEEMMGDDLRRGPWTVEEDFNLINYIAIHGEGRWNSLARCAGLKRTGKSCRLRWLNYLRPDVRRGNITLEEQLMILELHSRWGNRWSKIAQHLPGRTDNEIKNYWRTRVQKHAKQLKCDVNSKKFKDAMRYLWMPRLIERIEAAASSATNGAANNHNLINTAEGGGGQLVMAPIGSNEYGMSDNSTNAAAVSSDSFGTHQVSPVSDLTTDCYNHNYSYIPFNDNVVPNSSPNYCQGGYPDSICTDPSAAYLNQQGLDFQLQTMEQQWLEYGGDTLDNLWNVEDVWYLQQFNHNM